MMKSVKFRKLPCILKFSFISNIITIIKKLLEKEREREDIFIMFSKTMPIQILMHVNYNLFMCCKLSTDKIINLHFS